MTCFKRITAVILVQFLFVFLALSQGLPEIMPEEVGISGQRLERISPVIHDQANYQRGRYDAV